MSDAAKRPWCATCGQDVAEVLCPTCAKWWADNPPPDDAAHLSAYAAVSREAGFARGLLWGWLNLSDDPEARERLRRVTREFLDNQEGR